MQEVESALVGVLAVLERRDGVEHLEIGGMLPEVGAEANLIRVLAQIAMIADENGDLARFLAKFGHRRPGCGATDEAEYFVSEASVYRLLKAHDLITSPAYIVIKAAEEFKGCCHENLALAERKSERLGSSLGRRRCLPILERFASEDAERVAGNKMALNVERIMDDGVNG